MFSLENTSKTSSPIASDFSHINERFEQLFMSAKKSADDIGVDTRLQNTTFKLLSDLQSFDAKTAEESLQSLSIALSIGRVIIDFYDAPRVEPAFIWSSIILHDIGKPVVGKCLIDKSNHGAEWTEQDREYMKSHTTAGANMAMSAGAPTAVCRSIAEHHHKQFGAPWYGLDPNLNDLERTTRDCVAVADFTDAMSTRTNTRNAHLTPHERLNEIRANTELVFDDYNRGTDLAAQIFTVIAPIAEAGIQKTNLVSTAA
jgi:putative nucleotidyltransferase with HDIG domain